MRAAALFRGYSRFIVKALAWPLVATLFAPVVTGQTEPTAEETAVLCWVNYFRRDPQAFAQLVLDGNKPEHSEHVDWEMFTAELTALKPAPPLFFEPRLLDASRAHARYMILAEEYGHKGTVGRPGFTGEWPNDRARAAGYKTLVGECSWARGRTALEIVATYVVDAAAPGEGLGGMQEKRGHRGCMINAGWREAGVGLYAWGDGRKSNVKLYSHAQGVGRVLGGVAIEDRDGDEFYDIDEGLGGVHIAVGELSAVTSGSGAWRLDLARDDTSRKLVARLGPLELVREIAPVADNLQIDLFFDLRRAVADLESKLAKLPESAKLQQRALSLQLLELRPPDSEAETQLADEVADLKAGVLDGLGTWSRVEAERAFQSGKRSFAGTVIENWIRQAQTVDTLAREAEAARGVKNTAARAKRIRAAAADIERQLVATTSADLWRVLANLRRDLLAL
jgi:hypothetical protein